MRRSLESSRPMIPKVRASPVPAPYFSAAHTRAFIRGPVSIFVKQRQRLTRHRRS